MSGNQIRSYAFCYNDTFCYLFRHKVFGYNYLIVSSADILMECVMCV